MSRLTKENRKWLAKSILTRSPATSDEWEYAVSKEWIALWTEDKKPLTSSQLNSNESVPGRSYHPFTSSQNKADESLSERFCASFDQDGKRSSFDGSFVPIYMSTNDCENEYISETIWKMLASWFGIDPKHLLRRRPIYFSYMSLDPVRGAFANDFVVADRELDFLPVWVGDLCEVLKDRFQSMFEVYAWESFEHIRQQVMRALEMKINSSSKIRIWFGLKRIDTDLILEPIFDKQQMLITKLIELKPEVKTLMKTRSTEQINKKYLDHTSPQYEKSMERRPLGEDIFVTFSDQVPQLCIAVEEIGMFDNIESLGKGIEDSEPESIVAISSVRNEWEDELTRVLDQYTNSSVHTAKALHERLATSARNIVSDKLEEINEIRADYEKRFTALEDRENAARIKENHNNEKEVELKARLAIFKKELDDFESEKHKLMEDMKLIEEQNKISVSRISLNIGGIVYTTSLQTLTKEEDSLLSVMFSGKHALKREPDGTYFVDRDGLNFRYVLNYLRDGPNSVKAIPCEDKLIREILSEARYYRLAEMETLLQNKLSDNGV